MKNEMTIREMFGATIEACKVAGVECKGFDVIEFLEDRMAKSIKKSSSKTDEKKIAENKEIADLVVKAIDEIGRPARVGEIATSSTILNCGKNISSSKITSIVSKTNADMFVKSVEKGNSYYSVA